MKAEQTGVMLSRPCACGEERCVSLATDKVACYQKGQPSIRNGNEGCQASDENLMPPGNPRHVQSRLSRSQSGQSTVEYALALIAFLSIAIALVGVWRASRSGRLLDRAVEASSHQIGGGDALGSWRDISLF